jgi:hypothetical protein
MTYDLRSALPLLIPKAIAWAEAQSSSIGKIGQPLNDALLSVARGVGVMHPELIRVAEVPQLPLPEDPELQQAALATGLLGPNMIGMTFGYGIYICHGHRTKWLLSHEFRHAFQYEQAGSIAAFLPTYLQQIVTVGYHNAPFEIDARAHEVHNT